MFRRNSHHKQKGQSLTEVALFLPLFLVLIAGLTEIGQFVLTANRVSSASRSSTRFAANGGEDQGIRDVALNSVTQTLPLDADRWDIWAIRGTINDTGTGFDDWYFEEVYGVGNTRTYTEIVNNENGLQEQVLRELKRGTDGVQRQINAAGVQFAGSFVSYDAESILGFDTFVGEFFTVTDFNVMRAFPSTSTTAGCNAFPIAMHPDIRSVSDPDDATVSANDFPASNLFSYPPSPPSYSDFPSHTDNVVFDEASEGDLFYIKEGEGAGSFGWIVWNEYGSSDANRLAEALTWPGNSQNYRDTQNSNSGWTEQLEETYGTDRPVVGFINRGTGSSIDDTDLSQGSILGVTTGSVNSNAVREAINTHIDRERLLRVIIYDPDSTTGSGDNTEYEVERFALFRLIGYSLSGGNDSWILAEFVRLDDSCGQTG